MNLIVDPWIPIRRAGGETERIAPWQVTDAYDHNPPAALDFTRPDLAGSIAQFLVGLLQTSLTPGDPAEWRRWFSTPPGPGALSGAFARIVAAFEFDGPGARFMQDRDPHLAGEALDIAALLIDAPGGNALKNNTDHFVKRGRTDSMCGPCAAAALYTLQTNAPSGGVGHRTSIRGGGPLTTLVVSDPRATPGVAGQTLWCDLWLNVLTAEAMRLLPSKESAQHEPGDTFPWLAPTPTSEPKSGSAVHSSQTQVTQVYWGMPRRIRLDFEHVAAGRCGLCGDESNQLVLTYKTKNYGINYEGPWKHPLSPYRIDDKGTPHARHPRPGGISYRHWLGLVMGNQKTEVPALVVSQHLEKKLSGTQFRVWAFGYDMDNMKPRCWYDSLMPIYEIDDPKRRKDFARIADQCIRAATETSTNLHRAVKKAWFSPKAEVRGDLSFVSAAFWRDTEPSFYLCLDSAARHLAKGDTDTASMRALKERWWRSLKSNALRLFGTWVEGSPIEFDDAERIARAHITLVRRLHDKKLRGMLDLPPLEKSTSKKGAEVDDVAIHGRA